MGMMTMEAMAHDESGSNDLGGGARAPQVCLNLVQGLPGQRVLQETLVAARTGDIHNRALCFWLAEMDERGLSVLAGCPTTVDFARRRLDLSRRQARDLIATGRGLNELERIDEAFATGAISWSKTRLIVRVAVPETEIEWLARAMAVSTRELEAEVAASERGRRPREDRLGLPTIRTRISVRVDLVLNEMWELCQRKAAAESRAEVLPDDVLRLVCETYLRGGDSAGGKDSDPAEGKRSRDSLFRLVVRRCPDCRDAHLLTDDGPAPIDARAGDAISCDASGVSEAALRDLDEPPVSTTASNALSAVAVPLAIDDPTPRWLRDRVLVRDGLHCLRCQSRQELMVHHVALRSQGGRTSPSNLITLCARCHALVHEGLMRVEGEVPDGIRFLDRDGREVGMGDALREPDWRVFRVMSGGPPASPKGGARAPCGDDAGTADRAPQAATGSSNGVGESASEVVGVGSARDELAFDTLPDRVGPGWFDRHAHLLSWNEKRHALEVTPGRAAEVDHADSPGAAAPPTSTAAQPNLSFDAIVGQEEIVGRLRIAVAAATIERRPVAHVLFTGGPGLGKSTFARALAVEVGTVCHVGSGTTLRDPLALVGLLVRIRPNEVLFIDEVHALPARVAETLYEAMQERTLTMPVTDGVRTRTLVLEVAPFTLVGATTDPEKLPAPFVSRFPIHAEVSAYPVAELARIVTGAAAQSGVAITADAAALLAEAAGGAPRRVLGHWSFVRDFALADSCAVVDRDLVRRAFDKAGLDGRGLGPTHRAIVERLRALGRPVGAARLAAMMGIPQRVFREVFEADLLRNSLIAATPAGLTATVAAQVRQPDEDE